MRAVAKRQLRFVLLVALVIGVGESLPASAAALQTGVTPYVRVTALRSGKLTIVLTARGRRTFRRDLAGKRVLYAACGHLRASPEGVVLNNMTFPPPRPWEAAE
jgi:hypothetical protein